MIDPLRQQAWEYGRALRDRLVAQYREEYGVQEAPAPALIVDELLRDFLEVSLHFDPLPLDTYAQTEWKNGRAVVTVNCHTDKILGVKDAQGVQNVAKLHEAVHVERDLSALQPGPQLALEGFGPPPRIVCYRKPQGRGVPSQGPAGLNASSESRREFWAEEAGRAAAVSYEALARSDAFRAFIRLRESSSATVNGDRWQLLYLAAEHIGVNRSALVKQLQLEGQIVIQKEGGRWVIYPQPAFLTLMGE